MPPLPTLPQSGRLVSLDVFRGITMASMLLVNNAGDWNHLYRPVAHAKWNGWTPTDLVFPFFVFIVGVAMTFSFDRRMAQGAGRLRLFEQVVRRTIILFMLGMIRDGFGSAFPDWVALSQPSGWKLTGPFIAVILGLTLLFIDSPPCSWPAGIAARVRKILAWALLAGAIVFFAFNFRHVDESGIRIPGVLQRIALCYFFCSLIVLYSGVRGRVFWTAVLVVGYWLLLEYVSPPSDFRPERDFSERPEGLLHEWVDMALFHLRNHVYTKDYPDPEGVLSTIPAIATMLLGVLAGNWLHSTREKHDKAAGLILMASAAVTLGYFMNYVIPINKKIWSSSYVLFTAGLAFQFLAVCYWLVDVKGLRRWATPFLVFGTNAITVYFVSGIFGRLMTLYPVHLSNGQTTHLKAWLYQTLFLSWASPINASLLWAITYVLFWLLMMAPLYWRRIFIRI